jgi:para-aminobenzoate synthetase component 1
LIKESFKYDGELTAFLKKAVEYANTFSHFSFFQSNNIPYPFEPFKTLLAIGAREILKPTESNFKALAHFHQGDWLFGFLGYDLKNELESLTNNHTNHEQFGDIGFFRPQILIEVNGPSIHITAEDPSAVWQTIESTVISEVAPIDVGKIHSKISKSEYINTVQKLRSHIEEGDIYEINFCQEFYGDIKELRPMDMYWALNAASPKPFSAFQKFDDQYLICASPERFMKKTGNKLISQPIKGTIRRGNNEAEDNALKHQLRHDEKELAENMMIVDLVRNDLAKSSKTGSVKVEEIFGIYAFKQVFQMISTVSSELSEGLTHLDAIKNAFPMGSMTGAPKYKVMQLIEQYESSKRGIFSGAAGYITPEGDFDFNVVIRSIFLNMKAEQYSFQVGSAITYDSDPEKEYEECLLKASAIRTVLTTK